MSTMQKPKAKADRRTLTIMVRATAVEKATLAAAAARVGLDLSGWLRSVGLQAAARASALALVAFLAAGGCSGSAAMPGTAGGAGGASGAGGDDAGADTLGQAGAGGTGGNAGAGGAGGSAGAGGAGGAAADGGAPDTGKDTAPASDAVSHCPTSAPCDAAPDMPPAPIGACGQANWPAEGSACVGTNKWSLNPHVQNPTWTCWCDGGEADGGEGLAGKIVCMCPPPVDAGPVYPSCPANGRLPEGVSGCAAPETPCDWPVGATCNAVNTDAGASVPKGSRCLCEPADGSGDLTHPRVVRCYC
jgi:hypothetical protein